MSIGSRLSVSEYLQHHQHNWQIGFGGFWTINLDTLLISWLLMGLSIYFFKHRQKEFLKISNVAPSRFQVFIELIIEFARNLVHPFYAKENVFASAASFTTLVFLGLSNCLAFLPPDFFPYCMSIFGISNFKVQISSDINFCLSLTLFSVGISVFRPIQVYGIKSLVALYAGHPFPHLAFFPINVPLSLMGTFSKMTSLTLRLFINMAIGDLGFLLMAAYMTWWIQWLPWQFWTLFHFVVIPLQTYIFVLFSAVYLSLTLDAAQHDVH